MDIFYYTGKRKKEFPPPLATAQPIRVSHNSANEKPLGFKLPVYCNGILLLTAFSAFPFFYKGYTSPLFTRLIYGFAVACLSWIAILCYSPINPCFAGRITGGFTFKVNRREGIVSNTSDSPLLPGSNLSLRFHESGPRGRKHEAAQEEGNQ